jgi:glucose/arabinose dehydrogenase
MVDRPALTGLVTTLTVIMLAAGCSGAAGSDGPVALEPIVEDLEQPVFVTHAGDGSGRLFVVEQEGRIVVVDDDKLAATPLLDIEDRILCCGERGLLGLAFHPGFPDDPRFYVNYTRAEDGATVVSEFHLAGAGIADPASERILLVVAQPYGNHNGGMVAFGPDGGLYVGMGDGGSGGDPQNFAQNPDSRLGKMLRLDVDGAGNDAEVFAIGLRNPWRFSFDRANGKLWAGDVGQNAVEEISVIEQGGNYGWRIKEGTRDFEPAAAATPLIPPVAEYVHEDGRCSVTGGYVYRGDAIDGLVGDYIFADYCSGEIMHLSDDGIVVLLDTGMSISSFGEDPAGELYVVDHDGAVYRLVARSTDS